MLREQVILLEMIGTVALIAAVRSTDERRLTSAVRSARIQLPPWENSMKPKLASVVLIALLAFLFSAPSHTQAPGVSLLIEKHASLLPQGIVVIRIRIVCGPFAGIEEFQEGHAGGSQPRTGASSETGIDGTVICDGIERTHTAQLSPLDERNFKPGPASASAFFFLCTLDGEEQMCFSGATSRRVIIRGGRQAT